MTHIAELKKQLIEGIRQLQEMSDAEQKKKAYRTVVDLVTEIQKLDTNFVFNQAVLEPYSAFRTDDMPKILKKVNWTDREPDERMIKNYARYEATALAIVKNRFPKTFDGDSDKFGTIVNATIHNLVIIESGSQ